MPKTIQKRQFDGRGRADDCKRSPAFLNYRDKYYKEFKDLIMNSVKIDGMSFPDENFVKTQLFTVGYVGYYSLMDRFLKTIPETAILQYGRFWKEGQFFNEENIAIGRHYYNFENENENSWRILLATPSITCLFEEALKAANDLADCDVGIMQNIRAVRTPAFWVTDNNDFILSVKSAVQDTENGDTNVILEKNLSSVLSSMKNETPFIADKIQEQKKIIRNEFLTRIGILTANSSKRERVQTAEIEAGVGEAIDLIYTVIDYWNKQMKQYGLDKYKMTFNGTSEAYYAPTEEGEDNENNEVEE